MLQTMFYDNRRRFALAFLPRLFWIRIPGHTLPVEFELARDCIQFYLIANLDKTI